MISSLVIGALLVGCAFSAEERGYTYDAQGDWPGVCETGNQMRQSPINIETSNVRVNSSLVNLALSGWNVGYDGFFNNTGTTTRFTPNNIGGATTRNHLGMYELRNVHWHWGRRTGEGSEHRVDNTPAELEIHFVHLLRGATDPFARNYLTAIAVLADVVDGSVTGPWAQLNASRVQACDESIAVGGFRFDQLLPDSLDYYYYEGSFTSPPCTEVVNWFVLKNRVTVPRGYIDALRTTQQADGSPLTFNFRDAQALGDRSVYSQSSAATGFSGPPTTIHLLFGVTLLTSSWLL